MELRFSTRLDSGKPAMEHAAVAIFKRQLDRFARRITRVRVTLADINGPKGGCDMECHAELKLQDGPSVTVRARGETPLEALTLAAHRIRARCAKIQARLRSRNRRRRAITAISS